LGISRDSQNCGADWLPVTTRLAATHALQDGGGAVLGRRRQLLGRRREACLGFAGGPATPAGALDVGLDAARMHALGPHPSMRITQGGTLAKKAVILSRRNCLRSTSVPRSSTA